jgi:hypothetical protein
MAFLMPRISEDLGLRVTTRAGGGDLKVLSDVALPKEIVNILNSHYERVLAPANIQGVLRGYDSLQRIWKNLTLPIWPAYHARNLLSDFVMITHGADDYGLHIPAAIKAIADGSRGLAGKLAEVDIGQGRKIPWADFRKLLDKYGLIDYAMGRELEDIVLMPKGLINTKTGLAGIEERMSKTKIMDFAFQAGMYRQNSTNAGYFLGLLRKGVSPEVAALEVKKRLFDFSDLTNIEKQVLRRVFPFYSWLRHNIPYQIGAILHRPRTITEINWARDAMTGGKGPAGDVPLPSFLAQGLPVLLPGGGKGKLNFARMKGLLPVSDVMMLFNPIQEGWNALAPGPKNVYEMIGNQDTFQNQPLEAYKGEAVKFMGVPISKRWAAPIVNSIRPLYEVNNLVDPTRTVGQKLGGLSITKGYSMDPEQQTRVMWSRVRQREQDLKDLIRKAASKGNKGEVVKLRREIQDLHQHPRQVMH